MKRKGARLVAFALAWPIVGCGNGSAKTPTAADIVAQQFLNDDRQPPPTDPKLAKDFAFLNECTAKRIRASAIAFSDSQQVITSKVHVAMKQCTDELYTPKKP